jgi:hypothetical protein
MFVRALAGVAAFAQVAALTVSVALAAPPAAAPAAGIAFAGLTWGNTRRSVRSALATDGFTLIASTPDDFYRGTVDGNGATVTCVFTPDDELVFVRVIFDPTSNRATLASALNADYGKPASCDAADTTCRWQRGDTQVTYLAAGDPYAAPGEASLEYSAGGDLAQRYDQQINNKQFDRGEKTDM